MDFEKLVAGDYAGRRWIIVAEVAAAVPAFVDFLQKCGADDLFLVSGNRGVGDVPDIPTIDLEATGETIMGGIRAFEAAVLDLPDAARASIDAFDPDGTAGILFAGFGTAATIAGRPVFAPRRVEWLAIEDKIAVLDIWRESGIPTAPALVVAASLEDLTRAHRQLNSGAGTVVVADNHDGWHGGGEYLRRVRSEADLTAVAAFMGERADHVRVMPFLEGIPCSIHGFVTAAGVATFRPVELLILWNRDTLVYAGVATTWDPPGADREEMRRAARAVGETLRRQVGYRGGFSLDGILTVHGFRPTEINPRLSVGLGIQLGGIDDIPLGALTRHLVANPDAQIDLNDLELRIVANADANRTSRAMFATSKQLDSVECAVEYRDGSVQAVPDGPIQLSAGPSLHGGVVFVRADPGVVPSGASFAPVVAACAPFVEDWLGIEIGRLDFAVDVRT